MTTLNQGRNEIRFNNSGGKCLLENWVEERAVNSIDPQDLNDEKKCSAKLFKDGHQGLLTTEQRSKVEGLTTFNTSYRSPEKPNVREKGAKEHLLEKILFEQVSQEVNEQRNRPPSPVEYKSVTQGDFNIEGFQSKKIEPTARHDYIADQPATFWTEHREKLHGVSQVKVANQPFKKNTAFSKPIEESWDQPTPYEHDMVPNM